jgi:outer membrane protein, heavy metal efflux system
MRNFTKRLPPWVWLVLVIGSHGASSIAQDNVIELGLRDADLLLQQSNREIRLARRAFEAAQASTIAAGARPNPNLSLGVSGINPQAGVGGGSLREKTIDSSLRLDQVI